MPVDSEPESFRMFDEISERKAIGTIEGLTPRLPLELLVLAHGRWLGRRLSNEDLV